MPSQKWSNRSLKKILSLLMLFRKREFCQEGIFKKKYARAFLRDQKRLSYIPMQFPLWQFSFYKEHFYKRAFLQESILHGCTREHFKRATKGQSSVRAVASQLKGLNKINPIQLGKLECQLEKVTLRNIISCMLCHI